MAESPHKHLSGALEALFREYDGSPFALRLWDGWSWRSSSTGPEACTTAISSGRRECRCGKLIAMIGLCGFSVHATKFRVARLKH